MFLNADMWFTGMYTCKYVSGKNVKKKNVNIHLQECILGSDPPFLPFVYTCIYL